ncbi:MAG: ABC transporter permease subunit [Cyanobacteria bacterium REEB459]|nr:ABC transporter permease subunit [Cyanobacteria bacterium REEB459]
MAEPLDDKTPLWRDQRFTGLVFQAAVLVLVVGIAGVLLANMVRNLQQLGRQLDFGFLRNQSGFNIGESILPYQPNDTYGWALVIGLVNTLRLILIGFVTATVIGTLSGLASFSSNWLLRHLNLIYIEVARNTPLLLQLFFWYFVIFFGLAQGAEAKQVLGWFLISKKGIALPWPTPGASVWGGLLAIALLGVVAYLTWRWRRWLLEEKGQHGRLQTGLLLGTAAIALGVFLFGLGWSLPRLDANNNILGGVRISLEYAAMLAGLTFYTGAFIAEIVRGGIASVSKGQWEAARSLGLKGGLTMALVVLPQALRVIIPSLNGQYMNLAKNSSLALAIGYPDIFATGQTTQNQTGRAVEIVLLWAITYLLVNLIISVVMNQLNRTIQIRER